MNLRPDPPEFPLILQTRQLLGQTAGEIARLKTVQDSMREIVERSRGVIIETQELMERLPHP